MTAIQVRPATLADLPIVASLFDSYRQFYKQLPARETAATFIRARMENGESTILLAEDTTPTATASGPLGFCQLYPSFCSVEMAPIFVLYDLFVTPAARGAGAGKALLLAAHDHAATQGAKRLDLTTAKTNHTAQSLYESLGWVRDEVFYAYNLRVNR
ncbi:MAG TPA: GNAT family N-acetyltransferase [Burkholderiaceae bacterium]|jgi:ribosomal protein S18 acetylase RimI-like enzyme|nr:GNAT family N-acetyltransferase [Burkholderiaceae bacterium]